MAKLKKSARGAKRSVNAEIIARLEESFDPTPRLTGERKFLEEFVAELAKHGVKVEIKGK